MKNRRVFAGTLAALLTISLAVSAMAGSYLEGLEIPDPTKLQVIDEGELRVYTPMDFYGGNGAKGFEVTVLQDCWTCDEHIFENIELETYEFTPNNSIFFVWKHKIPPRTCSNYLATIVGMECRKGKVGIYGGAVKFLIPDIQMGEVYPDKIEELIFVYGPVYLEPGTYDWFLVTECTDTNGSIMIPPGMPDYDVDDICGANLGVPPENPLGPVIFGPEPGRRLDPDMGGNPPGRWPGEDGVTRAWCFTVLGD